MSLQHFHHYKIKFIILNSYEHFKLIEPNPQLNQADSVRPHCSSDSFVSFQHSWSSRNPKGSLYSSHKINTREKILERFGMADTNISSSQSIWSKAHLTTLSSRGLIKYINIILQLKHMIFSWQHRIELSLKDWPNIFKYLWL